MNDNLISAGVSKTRSYEDIHTEHSRMLARFGRNRLPDREWKHLERCDGAECPHAECIAACWFGERNGASQLVLDAHELLQSVDLQLWFVSVIHPRHRRLPGELHTLSIDGLQQTHRRCFRKLEAEIGKAFAIGGIEFSFDVELDGRKFWSPHTHMLIATEADDDDIKRIFRPKCKIPRGMNPVWVEEAYNIADAISYFFKRENCRRVKVEDKDERRHDPLLAPEKLELDRWLLSQPANRLQFLRGMRHARGTLTLLR